MKRILLDTNIYGLIVVDTERNTVKERIMSKLGKTFIVYGTSVIKNELRNTPKGFIDGINLRNDLMSVYREIIRNREFDISQSDRNLAESYFRAYRELGGNVSKKKIMNDFLIVASATNHVLDIVVSEDARTMLGDISLKSYKLVNSTLRKPMFRFISYEEFKRDIKK